MKLLIVMHDAAKGGVWTVVKALVPALQASGVEVRILLFSEDTLGDEGHSLPAQIDYEPIGTSGLKALYQRIVYTRRYVAQHAPDVIMTMELMLSLSTLLACPARRKDMVFAEHSPYMGQALYQWQHGSIWQRVVGLAVLMKYIAFYQCYRFAAKVVAPSRDVIALVQRYAWLGAVPFTYLPNPVAAAQLKPRDKQEGVTVFMACCRLSPFKGVDVLLDAMAIVTRKINAKLLIAGSGDLATYQKQAEKLGIAQYIEFIGQVGDVGAYLAQADVFVSASRAEALSYVLIEALQHGLPVISTNANAGPREVLEGGKYGILLPVDDVEAFAQAMIGAAAGEAPSNPQARQQYVSQFTVERSVQAYQEMLQAWKKP